MSAKKVKRLSDYMPTAKEPTKFLQVKIPVSLHKVFMANLESNDDTAQDVFMAAIKMYLEEKELFSE